MKKVIKFWAPWCGPCRMYAPTFDKVAEKFEGQVETLNVNVDEDKEISAEYNVRSIPHTVLVKEDGTKVSKTGALSAIELEELFLS
jgi:thioredoxin 1